MGFDFDVVVKIGSMAMISKMDNDFDYNIVSRLARDLRPGYILVSSGAAEIGRLDYIKRNGSELRGDGEEIKTDYSAQGQSILMEHYRRFIDARYSVRQVLVEHGHFNDPEKAEHLKKLFFRAANQNAIPIVNYNDPVSGEETRRLEIASIRGQNADAVECVDNDETAAVIAQLVNAKILVLLTSTEGIYKDVNDPSTVIEQLEADSLDELEIKLNEIKQYCVGASREGANGAISKLVYAAKPLENGSTVIVAHARHRLKDILAGKVRCTLMNLR